MSTTVFLDANSIGYLEHYGARLNSGNLQTQSIFGFVHKMRNLKVAYPGCSINALWDGRADWRFDLCPTYKSNRDNDPKKAANKAEYQKARPYIGQALGHLGVRQITSSGHEADDLAGYFVKRLTVNPDNRIVLHSSDHDWYQMIGPNVVIRDPKTADFVLKTSNFQEVTGYRTPLAFLEGKALQGDDSDVIPGIPKMGEKTAAEFLATWGSVFNFFKAVDSGEYTPKKRTSEKAKSLHPEEFLASPQGRRIFLRNLKIMQLLNVARPQEGEMVVKPGAVNKQAFAELCEELAFSSILRDLDRFFAPFES